MFPIFWSGFCLIRLHENEVGEEVLAVVRSDGDRRVDEIGTVLRPFSRNIATLPLKAEALFQCAAGCWLPTGRRPSDVPSPTSLQRVACGGVRPATQEIIKIHNHLYYKFR